MYILYHFEGFCCTWLRLFPISVYCLLALFLCRVCVCCFSSLFTSFTRHWILASHTILLLRFEIAFTFFFCSFSRVCWLLHGQKRINTLEANDNSNTQIDRKNRIQPIEKITFVLNQWRHKLYIVYVYRGDAFISLLSHSKLTNRKCFCCSP